MTEEVKKINGVKVYQTALARVPNEQRPLIDRYIQILGKVHTLYELQKLYGFFPEGVTREEIEEAAKRDSQIKSPYTLVRRQKSLPIDWIIGRESLHAVRYTEDKAFRDVMLDTATMMDDAAQYAILNRLPQGRLIEARLRSQSVALRDGNIEGERFRHLNTHQLPQRELLTGLFDRYLDTLFGIKFGFQGWLIDRDDGQTGHYNAILQTALKKRSDPTEVRKHRVIVGDAIAMAGMAADREWTGNTLPSEDNLRKEIGSTGYAFRNTLDRKFEEKIGKALRTYVFGEDVENGLIRLAKRAAFISLILHESVGHTLVPFDEIAEKVLEGDYMAAKEWACELIAHSALFVLPSRLVPSSTKEMTMYASCAWARGDIDEHLSEIDPAKRDISRAYARSGAGVLAYYQRLGFITVNSDNGRFSIVDLNGCRNAALEFPNRLEEAIRQEHEGSRSLRDFVHQNMFNPDFSSLN